MDLSKASSVWGTSSGIQIFQQKDSNSGQYGGIFHKDSNKPRIQIQANYTIQYKVNDDTFQYFKEIDEDPPEESNLTSFEGDK